MGKKGLIGKIFLIIGLVLLAIIFVVAITAYQVYGFMALLQEAPLLEEDINSLSKGDCSKVKSIETRISNIKSKAENACKNPLIKEGLKEIGNSPFNCDNLGEAYSSFLDDFELAKEGCNNS